MQRDRIYSGSEVLKLSYIHCYTTQAVALGYPLGIVLLANLKLWSSFFSFCAAIVLSKESGFSTNLCSWNFILSKIELSSSFLYVPAISERKISDEKAIAIEDMTSSGMRATESFRYLAHNAGGEENFGRVLSITSQAGKSIPWRHNITRKFYNLVLRSEDNEDAIKIIEESLQRDSLAIDSLSCTESVRMLSSGKSSSNILDPARSRTKERGKRAKGHFEVSKKKRGGTSTSVQANEFGSKTPKPHLF
ncbi:hypothetical protein ACS0TY_022986 [Phlomoides rotata]